MIRKDWKKQQQKERQARRQSSPPTKEQTKSKSNKVHKDQAHQIENEKVQIILFNNIIDSDLLEAPDRPRTNRNRSRSSEHSHVNNSSNRSKSPITYP